MANTTECYKIPNYPFDIYPNDKKRETGVLVGPKKYRYPSKYLQCLEKFYNFETRPDSDVLLFGFPRSGTTPLQELLWLIGNDLNYEKASRDIIDVRFPVFETSGLFNEEFVKLNDKIEQFESGTREIVEKWARPAWDILAEENWNGFRFIKTHLALSLGPPNLVKSGCKIVCVARDPRDVCVSLFLLNRLYTSSESPQEFEAFWRNFRSESKYFELLNELWAIRNEPNVLFLFYEDVVKDLRITIKRVAKFLDKNLDDQQIDGLVDHLKIDNFRENKSVNNHHLHNLGLTVGVKSFIRKGKSGGWRDYFTGDLRREVEEWMEENLKGPDPIEYP